MQKFESFLKTQLAKGSFSGNRAYNIWEFYKQKLPPEVFYEKGALRNFAKFTGKHLSQSLVEL